MVAQPHPAPHPTPDKPPRRRRWVPVSLRLFVLILIGVGIGSQLWVGIPAYRRHLAIQEIRALGGQCFFEPAANDTMRDLIGEESVQALNLDPIDLICFYPDEPTFDRRFRGVFAGSLHYAAGLSIDDRTLACVARIPIVRRLDLRWTNVGDSGMQHVARLRELTELNLDGTDVSDLSGPILARFSRLRRLSIINTRITDAGLAHLRPLPDLEVLRADDSQLTQVGVDHLAKLPRLNQLYVYENYDLHSRKRFANELRRALPSVSIGFVN